MKELFSMGWQRHEFKKRNKGKHGAGAMIISFNAAARKFWRKRGITRRGFIDDMQKISTPFGEITGLQLPHPKG
jgi:hypothetical protein